LARPNEERCRSLSQALIVVFKEAFPLARNNISSNNEDKGAIQSLDATGIPLDNAFLLKADLKQVMMPQASLRKAHLNEVDLRGADLAGADLSRATLIGASLEKVSSLEGTNLWGVKGLTREQLET